MKQRVPGAGQGGTSVRLSMMRATSLALAVSWLLWQTLPVLAGVSEGWLTGHWYPAVTASLFLLANLMLFVAAAVNREGVFVFTFRFTGLTLVIALVLLLTDPYTGENNGVDGLWFTGFSALPAVAFAVVAAPWVAIAYYLVMYGGAVVANAVIAGYTDPGPFLANVGFALVNPFFFVIFAAYTLRLGTVVDRAETRARQNSVRATRLKARSEEMTRFTALIHDNILANLSAIGQRTVPDGLLEVRLATTFEGSAEVTPQMLADAASAAVREATPDCEIETDFREDARLIPTVVASPMVLALAEVARNSAKHAPGAHRQCRLRIAGSGVGFRYRDDGPGFDPEDLRPTAAGLRISVQGRMAAVDGGEVHIDAAPGEGADVRLLWEAGEAWDTGQGDDPDDVRDSDAVVLQRTPLQYVGLDIVYSWPYMVAIAAALAAMLAANADPWTPAGAGTWVLTVVGLALLVGNRGGTSVDLPRWRAVGVAVVLAVVPTFGLWQQTVEPETWLRQWHLSAAALVASLLVARGRPREAVTGLGVGFVLFTVVTSTGVSPDTYNSAFLFLGAGVLVIAAVLVHVGLHSFVRRVPAAQERLRASASEEAAARETAEQRAENLRLLEGRVGPVFTAAAAVPEISAALARRAQLAEMGLRDMIRSPLLDDPVLRQAVWDARDRGVMVLLLDDLSRQFGDGTTGAASREEAERNVDRLLGQFVTAVDAAQPGAQVTVRLLPPGRSAFATVTGEDGAVRFSAPAGPAVV
ncbi:sensor histidine kinase [Corynebacterium variabile]|uniref:sensor histidine kinase n=1 Tax=Corynebacterium variabile TaxID=1727 RepID=UPI003A8E42B9